MKTIDYSRIKTAIDTAKIQSLHIVVVGAGGSYSLIQSLSRCGIGTLTVLDIDTVDPSNIARQGYNISDIGTSKVAALKKSINKINPHVNYIGLTKNFLEMSEKELDSIFQPADLLLFLTDDFRAQSFGNTLALKYLKPAIWAGWYEHSRTSEIFYQIPEYTETCFRCCMSYRYLAHTLDISTENTNPNSNSNTIFHSQLLDSQIGILSLAILNRSKTLLESNDLKPSLESELFFVSLFDENKKAYNYFHHKAHPNGGNILFDKAYGSLGGKANLFMSHWQKVSPELKPEYNYDCPDCKGVLKALLEQKK